MWFRKRYSNGGLLCGTTIDGVHHGQDASDRLFQVPQFSVFEDLR